MDDSTDTEETLNYLIEWWTFFVLAIICITAYIYAFVVIVRKPETRMNLPLLLATVFHLIGVVFMCARLFVTGLDRSPIIEDIYGFALNMAGWIFQTLLLETALMLPLIFNDTYNRMETYEVTTRKLEARSTRIKYALNFLLVMPAIQIAIAVLFEGFDAIFRMLVL